MGQSITYSKGLSGVNIFHFATTSGSVQNENYSKSWSRKRFILNLHSILPCSAHRGNDPLPDLICKKKPFPVMECGKTAVVSGRHRPALQIPSFSRQSNIHCIDKKKPHQNVFKSFFLN